MKLVKKIESAAIIENKISFGGNVALDIYGALDCGSGKMKRTSRVFLGQKMRQKMKATGLWILFEIRIQDLVKIKI